MIYLSPSPASLAAGGQEGGGPVGISAVIAQLRYLAATENVPTQPYAFPGHFPALMVPINNSE